MATTMAPHIRLDDRGVAWIDNTNTKVREVVLDKLAHDWTAEDMHREHPHLSLAQLHAALAYYYDHKAEVDAEIEGGLRMADEKAKEAADSPIRKKLRAMGKI